MHPVTSYARAVVQGKVPACRWAMLACERLLLDLALQKKKPFPYRFDEELADRAVEFYSYLKHSKGKWAGQEFILEPWQIFIVGNIFGWVKKADGLRRFQTVYIEVPRKNGKSTLASGIGLYCFIADGEPGAEVYTAATKRDQARITHGEAVRMVRKSPFLRSRIKIYKDNMHIIATAAVFEPLGADADSMDGLNVLCAIIDELHAHKKRDTFDVLETATGARQQPILFSITTAGFDRQSVCFEQHDYLTRILKGAADRSFVDDTYFGVIYGIDDDDDYRDPHAWAKANPNLGVSVNLEDLERKVRKASASPASLNNLLRKHFDKWVQQSVRWIDMDLWRSNADPEKPVYEEVA